MSEQMLLAFEDEAPLAQVLAQALGAPLAFVQRHAFPDGELRLRLPEGLPPRVLMLRGLQQPNEKLVELLLCAPAARELGARELILLSPYLAYMRQDMAFTPGEVVSQRHVAALLGSLFDAVLTVDPHLHRVRSMDELFPGRRGLALSAAPLLGQWVAQQLNRPILIGPDEEATQWVRAAAQPHALEWGIGRKCRLGDREVILELPPLEFGARAVVLLDDVASTGQTLIAAATQALARGAASVDVAVTHALFVGDALAQLHEAGVRHVWSTDAVPHPSNVVSVAPLLAQAVAQL
ncbi:ribose-phosphate diphosphokinase [Azohydromonas caseinilytica]|uniref:Ribose-phosphate diphosphokinase n=1 Tax=Azohydromonas caseinilytica TaxID=2728836 RepID=A0A848F9K0_9BURK|nr:ribose-phosphate diphosphokinase [Azohydromonas caseinilytica]NML15139.1 ribose-phosphate diphosphokinase [Azohydromonas caseinilytica]